MPVNQTEVTIPHGEAGLHGTLTVPEKAWGTVVFAHGSGSSRFSPRNRSVAESLNTAGMATLLLDLLTDDEEQAERYTRHLRFDVAMLTTRLVDAIRYVQEELGLPVGLFGASTGAAAALMAAAEEPAAVRAIVSRGGRPDLAGDALAAVRAPTLLLVGDLDIIVIELNEQAARRMNATVELTLVPGASHLFEEPGTLDQVAQQATVWFRRHLPTARQTAVG